MAIKGNELVEKRNILNEVRKNNMSLQELRFFSIYLSKINARDPNTRKVTFPLTDFQKIMELGRMNIRHMQAVTNSLLGKVVNIKLENGGYEAFQLFKRCKVYRDEFDQWFIDIDAHDDALPLMFQFKKEYFTYELWNALRLKSPNHLRMYELLKQYEKTGERKITLQDLRAMLGIAPNEYPRWDNFKRRIIDGSREALAENTDICFDYEPIKAGRKIVGVHFFIKKNLKHVDKLSLDEFIDQQDDCNEIDGEEELEQLSFLPESEIRNVYDNDLMEFYAEAFNFEFTQEQLNVILSLTAVQQQREFGLSANDNQMKRQDYLEKKYAELNYRCSRADLPPVKDRFAYYKSIIEAD